jgi:hypothetical protein
MEQPNVSEPLPLPPEFRVNELCEKMGINACLRGTQLSPEFFDNLCVILGDLLEAEDKRRELVPSKPGQRGHAE